MTQVLIERNASCFNSLNYELSMIDSSKEVPSEVVSFDKSSMVLEVKTSDSYKSGRYAIKIRAYNT